MSGSSNDLTPPAPSVLVTLAMLAAIVPFVAGMIGLFVLTGAGFPYFGFLFILYWAGVMRLEPAEFLPSVLGSLCGIGLAWLLIALPSIAGLPRQVIGGVALAGTLFCLLRGQAHIIINNAVMLFLTVSAISELEIAKNVWMMVASTLIGAAYMGILVFTMRAVGKRASRKEDAGLTAAL
ncbi:MAG TPA: hypothetical protein VF503_29070 [Sphingobium sp.]|uniref:hypothetical protein n=1 Tax=Sphingobium sp. TaxID=1912891 RepID=UPI002ED592B5